MKTLHLKIFQLIAIIALCSITVNAYSFLDAIDLKYPKTCQDYFSSVKYPYTTKNVKFVYAMFSSHEDIRVKITLIQGSNTNEVHNQVHYISNMGGTIEVSVALDNITGFNYNNLVQVKVEATGLASNMVKTQYGYAMVYRNGDYGGYLSATNGSSQQVQGYHAQQFYSKACGLSGGNYFATTHKVTFTVSGNFQGQQYQAAQNQCAGYSGANPNNQNYWGTVASVTNNEIKLYTFVYYVYNSAGQDIGWVPCAPEEAAVMYQNVTVNAPNITSFSQSPNPFWGTYNTCYVYCNATGYNNSYSWTAINTPYNFNVQFPGGNYAIITRTGGMSSSGELDMAPPFRLRCVVNNSAGSDRDSHVVVHSSNPPPYSCPTLKFTELFSSLEQYDENTLLVKSPSQPSVDIDDHYLVINPTLKNKEIITFDIHEPENSITSLDNLELWQVDVAEDEFVAVTDDGTIINFKKPELAASITTGIEDLTSTFAKNDGLVKTVDNGMIINIESKSAAMLNQPYLYVRIRVPIVAKDLPIGNLYIGTESAPIPMYSRNNDNAICFQLPVGFENGYIDFLQGIDVDQLLIVDNLSTYYMRPLVMQNAIHNIDGDVKRTVANVDQGYAVINPDESISFEFTNDTYTANPFYIVKSRGHYIQDDVNNDKDGDALNSSLGNNHPNPFNPKTIINFVIAKAGYVKLKVYDIAGREIYTLINEYKNPGEYSAIFDGSQLSSGVYFYKLDAPGFTGIKKMILIK